MEILYIGKFKTWSDKNEDDVYNALEKFDKVKICVFYSKNQMKAKKGQPTKVLQENERISIISFKSMKKLLKDNKDSRYILFER